MASTRVTLCIVALFSVMATTSSGVAQRGRADGEFRWIGLAGSGGCSAVGSVRVTGPLIFTSPTKGHRYLFAKGRCPNTVNMGGVVKVYQINAAYPNYNMIKVVETKGAHWVIRRELGTDTYRPSKVKSTPSAGM